MFLPGLDSKKSLWLYFKQRPIMNKPWPIQTVAVSQDSCRLSRQEQTVKTVADCRDSSRLSRQLQTVNISANCSRILITCFSFLLIPSPDSCHHRILLICAFFLLLWFQQQKYTQKTLVCLLMKAKSK